MANAATFPDGKVFVVATRWEANGGDDGVYEAESWDPRTEMWTTLHLLTPALSLDGRFVGKRWSYHLRGGIPGPSIT
jgi:hypothetical protein